MAITAGRLIKELRKFPPDAKVVFANQDHNSDEGEFDSFVLRVCEASEAIQAEHPDVKIVLRG